MQPRGPSSPAGEPGPLDEETHARVLDHQLSGMIQAISEKGLHLIRIRAAAGSTHTPGTRIELEDVRFSGKLKRRRLSSPNSEIPRSPRSDWFPTELGFASEITESNEGASVLVTL